MIDYKTRALELAKDVVELLTRESWDWQDKVLADKIHEQARILLQAQGLDDEARDLLMQHQRARGRAESDELYNQYLAKVRETNVVLGEYPAQPRLMMRGD